MVVVSSHMELVALELGMQAVARHSLQVKLDTTSEQLVDAQARVAELEKALGIDTAAPVPARSE